MKLVRLVAVLLLCCTAVVTRTNGSSAATTAQEAASRHDFRYSGELSYSGASFMAGAGALGPEESPGRDGSNPPKSDLPRHLQDSICTEYSEILTYCCGAEAKLDCEASGASYQGPDKPCEVVKVDVLAGPPSCTGLTNSSGVLDTCQCGEGLALGGGSASGETPAPALTGAPSSLLKEGEKAEDATSSPTAAGETRSSGSWRAASPPSALLGFVIMSCALVAALAGGT